MTRYARKFRRISRTLSRVALMKGSLDESFSIDDRELLDKNAGRRFLDFYGDEGLRLGLERYGLLDALRERGYGELSIETHAQDDRHTLLIDADHDGRSARLVELVVRRDRLRVDPPEDYEPPLERTWEVLTVDWLSLRDPRASFTKTRMRLPGQDAPGLGVGERVLELLYRVADRLALDGMITVAEYFHNAVLYARELPFVDPWYAGQLRALSELLFDREKLSFAQAAWAVHWGHVRGADDRAVRWSGQAMIHTHEPELTAYLASKRYAGAAAQAETDLKYRLDRSAFDEDWAAHEDALLAPPTRVEP